MTRRLAAAAIAGAAAAVLLTGCTATSRPPAGNTRPTAAVRTPSPRSSPPLTSLPPSTSNPATPSTSDPATSSSPAPSSTPAPPPSSPLPRSTCSKLTVRVLIGSGAPGYEFAALQFVNDGSSPCTLAGVPTVTLLRNGTPTGTVSQPSSSRAPYGTYRLAPGATAESRLKDFSDCNAPLSDTVRVVAPGSSITTTRPGVLRACRLVVYPLGAPE